MTVHHRLVCAALLAAGAAWAPSAQAQHSNLYAGDEVVALEDVATAASDADQNDVAMRVNRRCEVDGSGDLVHEEIHLTALAAGAYHTNEVWLHLLGTADTVTLAYDGGAPQDATPDASGRVPVFADFREAFEGTDAGFVNTEPDGSVLAGIPVTVEASYTAGPFLDGTCPKVELGIQRDGTVIDSSDRLAANDQPLVLHAPDGFEVPGERVPMEQAYPDFLTWVADAVDGCAESGCAAEDWASSPASGQVVARPSLATTAPLEATASCSDGVQNQDETGIDCGGDVCGSCTVATCDELYQEGERTSGWYDLDPDGDGTTTSYYCTMLSGTGGYTRVVEWWPSDGAAAFDTTFPIRHLDQMTVFDFTSNYLEWRDHDVTMDVMAYEAPIVVPNQGHYRFFVDYDGTSIDDAGVWWFADVAGAHENLLCLEQAVDGTYYSSDDLSWTPSYTCSNEIGRGSDPSYATTWTGQVSGPMDSFHFRSLARGSGTGDIHRMGRIRLEVR